MADGGGRVIRESAPRVRWSRPGAAVLAIGLAVALLVTGVVWAGSEARQGRGLAASASTRVSSTALGSSVGALTDTGDATLPGEVWESDRQSQGAWIELRWSSAQQLREIVLVASTQREHQILSGSLSFSDGSSVLVRMSATSAQTVVPITVRSVTWVRFTVAEAAGDVRQVSLAEIIVSPPTGPASEPGRPDGVSNAALEADASASSWTDDGSPDNLRDGRGSGLGRSWATDRPWGSWVELTWTDPQELASVQLVGAEGSSARVVAGTLSFSDGSRVAVGAVEGDSRLPTVVGFMPRIATSVRFSVDSVSGGSRLALSELRVFSVGATPPSHALSAEQPPPPPPTRCADATNAAVTRGLAVTCPLAGAEVRGVTTVTVRAAQARSVRAVAWSGVAGTAMSPEHKAAVDRFGSATMSIDFAALPRGPVTVRVTADAARDAATYLQLYNASVAFRDGPRAVPSASAAGKTLVFEEEFEAPLSLSRDGRGARYAAAKPTAAGAEDFGLAIFPDPGSGFGNVRVVDHRFLHIGVQPNPPGYVDPSGWGRTRIGGLLASARSGGSGVSAQYGYFETRMLVPAGDGLWPAFWMLPTSNLVSQQEDVAEIDAVEMYGHDPVAACHSTHEYHDGSDTPNIVCGRRFDSVETALRWHTYGVRVEPASITYYIDDEVVATAPQVRGGDQAMFFLLDLALGGGWPIRLNGTGDRASIYVDYVRVYV